MNFERIVTAQGVPLYYLRMPFVKSVAAGVLVKAGTRDEIWSEEAGLAHALEHVLFQGTEEFPDSQSFSAYIEDVGGHLNAWTDAEMTLFYNILPTDKIERGIYSLSQMIRKPLLPERNIQTEMQNIVQEIRRANDVPQIYLMIKAGEIVYNGHPLGRSGLGTEEAVNSFKSNNFRNFMQKFYHPANYTFIVVGNFEIGQIKDLFEKYFPETVNLPTNQRSQTIANLPQDKLFIISRQVEQCHLIIGTSTCSFNNPDKWPLRIFRTMIDGGSSSPLFQEVREKRGLAYEVQAECDFWSDLGSFDVYIGTDPERKDEAIRVALSVIQDSKNSTQLLKKAKEMAIGRMALKYESTNGILQIAAEELGKTGTILSFEEIIQKIKSVTIEQVEAVVNKYLSEDRLVTVMLVPELRARK